MIELHEVVHSTYQYDDACMLSYIIQSLIFFAYGCTLVLHWMEYFENLFIWPVPPFYLCGFALFNEKYAYLRLQMRLIKWAVSVL